MRLLALRPSCVALASILLMAACSESESGGSGTGSSGSPPPAAPPPAGTTPVGVTPPANPPLAPPPPSGSGAAILVEGTGATTTEGGAPSTFTIKLATEPKADVTITITSDTPTEGAVAPGAVTFTAANWSTPQTITVTGVDDPVADGDKTFHVSFSVTTTDAAYAAATPPQRTYVNIDDETPGVLVTDVSNGAKTTEGTGEVTFKVRLRSKPSATVTLPVASDNPAEGVVLGASSLVFTTANWADEQTVTVRGVDDVVDDGDQAYQVDLGPTASADPAYDALAVPSVDLENVDDDTLGIVLGPPSGNARTTEAGGAVTFTVKLGARPDADVTVPLASDDVAEGTPSAASLLFTPATWDVAQTVTVTGVADFTVDGDKAYQIDFGPAVSADTKYSGITAPSVDLVNADVDEAGFVVTPITNMTDENGTQATFTVALRSRPAASVTVTLASSDTTEGTIDRSSLTFLPAAWNVPQTVTVTGKPDGIADGNVDYEIAFAAATSADPLFAGLTPPAVAVTNVDEDMSCLATCAFTGDDFDDGDINGWSTSGPVVVSVPPGGASGSSSFLQIDGGSGGHNAGALRTFTPCQANKLTVWIKPSSLTLSHNYVIFGDGALTANHSIGFIWARSTGVVLAFDGTTEYPLVPTAVGVWTKIEVRINWVSKTIDIDVDGIRRATAVPFREPAINDLSSVFLYNFASTIGAWDQLSISCLP